LLRRGSPAAASERFEINLSAAEWRARLTPAQFAVLREEDTEPPFSSPLEGEKRAGLYLCAGCDLPVYDAATKFDSGTGWPSFWEAVPGNVGTKRDFGLFLPRTEVHCRRCGGHLGHVFEDGPPPTGLRHCINGLALKFSPAVTG
jgi:peptide-methionine (R)-S-oxide reductase